MLNHFMYNYWLTNLNKQFIDNKLHRFPFVISLFFSLIFVSTFFFSKQELGFDNKLPDFMG